VRVRMNYEKQDLVGGLNWKEERKGVQEWKRRGKEHQ
jgi:hypothetical protein